MATRVHHLNCGTMCPVAARSLTGEGSLFDRGRLVCRCALVETDSAGLVLVDTGIGRADCLDPTRFSAVFRTFVKPRFDPAETAYERIRALGFSPEDVRHVVVTHLDLDHAGGLPDFPHATVHGHGRELAAMEARATLNERERYLKVHFAHGPRWKPYSDEGDGWMGLRAVRLLDGLDDLALVPLFGHTRGHSGVAIRDGDRWWLHAGDAYFHHGELEAEPWCPWGLELFQSMMAIDDGARRANAEKLGRMAREHAGEVTVFSAHDPRELDAAPRSV